MQTSGLKLTAYNYTLLVVLEWQQWRKGCFVWWRMASVSWVSKKFLLYTAHWLWGAPILKVCVISDASYYCLWPCSCACPIGM